MKKVFLIMLTLVLATTTIFAAGNTEKKSDNGIVTIDARHTMEGSNGKAMSSLISEFNATKGQEL